MKQYPAGSIVFRLSILERFRRFLIGVLFAAPTTFFLFELLPAHGRLSEYLIFSAALCLYIFFLYVSFYFFKHALSGVDFVIAPQYIEAQSRLFSVSDIENAFMGDILCDGGITVTRAAFARQPFFHKLMHRYGFLVSGALILLTAAGAIVAGSISWLKFGKAALVGAVALAVGIFQYKNGRKYLLDVSHKKQTDLRQALSHFCTVNKITFIRSASEDPRG